MSHRCAPREAVGKSSRGGAAGVCDGTMKAGKMDGYGVLAWANGFCYQGWLRDGKQCGYGTLSRAEGGR